MQSLFFLNAKFQVSSHVLWLCSSVCVGPGLKPDRWFSHDNAQIPSDLSFFHTYRSELLYRSYYRRRTTIYKTHVPQFSQTVWTDRSMQTVQPQIRLPLEEQFDLGLHSLRICLHLLQAFFQQFMTFCSNSRVQYFGCLKT